PGTFKGGFGADRGVNALMSAGVDRVADGDPFSYRRYIGALMGLWRRTDFLDRLHDHAIESTDRLTDDLRFILRQIEDVRPELFDPDAGFPLGPRGGPGGGARMPRLPGREPGCWGG